jgi:hypothetical protein
LVQWQVWLPERELAPDLYREKLRLDQARHPEIFKKDKKEKGNMPDKKNPKKKAASSRSKRSSWTPTDVHLPIDPAEFAGKATAMGGVLGALHNPSANVAGNAVRGAGMGLGAGIGGIGGGALGSSLAKALAESGLIGHVDPQSAGNVGMIAGGIPGMLLGTAGAGAISGGFDEGTEKQSFAMSKIGAAYAAKGSTYPKEGYWFN